MCTETMFTLRIRANVFRERKQKEKLLTGRSVCAVRKRAFAIDT